MTIWDWAKCVHPQQLWTDVPIPSMPSDGQELNGDHGGGGGSYRGTGFVLLPELHWRSWAEPRCPCSPALGPCSARIDRTPCSRSRWLSGWAEVGHEPAGPARLGSEALFLQTNAEHHARWVATFQTSSEQEFLQCEIFLMVMKAVFFSCSLYCLETQKTEK